MDDPSIALTEARFEILKLRNLLRFSQICGDIMSKALGSDECTVPWDDDISPRITEALNDNPSTRIPSDTAGVS